MLNSRVLCTISLTYLIFFFREFQDALIHDRDQEIRAIQAQMLEINEIFKNVATLVDEQGELVGILV